MTDQARTYIAIIVAPEGNTGLWRVHPEGHSEHEMVVFSDMPPGYSFAPGSRVTVREVIQAQKHSIVGPAPAATPAIGITAASPTRRTDKKEE
jgi:hypothetical protein